jgi:hypothetical protein
VAVLTENTYDEGTIVEMNATYLGDDNVTPVDPTAVAFSYAVIPPGSATRSTTVVLNFTPGTSTPAVNVIGKLSTGIYQVWIDTTGLPGDWTYDWTSSGTGQAAESTKMYVTPKAI